MVSVESWRQEPLWGGRGDVASLGRAPDPLRHEARRVDELTGVIASEGPGSHNRRRHLRKVGLILYAANSGTSPNIWNLWVSRVSISPLWTVGKPSRH